MEVSATSGFRCHDEGVEGKEVVVEDSLPHLPQAPTILVEVRFPVPELALVQLQGQELSWLKGDDVLTESFGRKAPAVWCGCQGLVLVDEALEELDPQDPQHPCEPV